MVLVLVVVFVFLGNWRATFIPMLAVPVSLVGTFALFAVFGFSINLLTLFGIILAIGLVVDDAIVVVEAVEAFMGGIAGQLYKQFALTLAISVLLSAFVALSLTPALCVLLLRPRKAGRGPISWALGKFNSAFLRATNAYVQANRWIIRLAPLVVLVLLGIYAGTFALTKCLPTAFLPDEDLGYSIINVQLPDATSLQRTEAAMEEAQAIIRGVPGVENAIGLSGIGLIAGANTSNIGTFFVTFKPWDERKSPSESAEAIIQTLNGRLRVIPKASIFAVNSPPSWGLEPLAEFNWRSRTEKVPTSRFLKTRPIR